jgi:hypothetical protein
VIALIQTLGRFPTSFARKGYPEAYTYKVNITLKSCETLEIIAK